MARRFQFRLRTLLLAVVPVALIVLPLGHWVRLRPPAPERVPVTGTVTLDGVPLEGAYVSFGPIESVPPNGAGITFVPVGMWARALKTDVAGKFKLESDCRPGSCAVFISKYEKREGAPPGAEYLSVIPERYSDLDVPCLSAKVTRVGPNDFTFNLTTP